MIYVNRRDAERRKDAIEKMKRIFRAGSSVLLFLEGGYNNTENQLIQPLFIGHTYGIRSWKLRWFRSLRLIICVWIMRKKIQCEE